MRKDLIGFINTGKQNDTRQSSCLTRVTNYWEVQYRDKFADLNYFCSSQTFYKKVIMFVRLAETSLRCKIVIQKLNNIMIKLLTNP